MARRGAPLLAIFLVASLLFGLSPGRAAADLLATGNTDLPADGSQSISGGTLLASDSTTASSGPLHATLDSWVYQGAPSNPFVAGGGSFGPAVPDALTFVYQINNVGTDQIEAFEVQSWGSLLLNVGYDGTGLNVAPFDASRSGPPSANVVEYDFPDPTPILPGQMSEYLIIDTPATSFSGVSAAIQDGSNVRLGSFAVYAPGGIVTPEPSSVVMMVLGLVGWLVVLARGRVRNASL